VYDLEAIGAPPVLTLRKSRDEEWRLMSLFFFLLFFSSFFFSLEMMDTE